MSVGHKRVAIIIPARFDSSRFPGKPLAQLANKALIQHVYEKASQVASVDQVLVATNDLRIKEAVEAFGGLTQMVTTPCRTGTDRVAAVARSVPNEIIVNLQADEILLNSNLLSDLINNFVSSTEQIGTLKRPLESPKDLSNPSVVKVVTDQQGKALYFSRSPIPHIRDKQSEGSQLNFASVHLGVYIFRREALFHYSELPTGILEKAEQLEQLRAIEHGMPIHVWETVHSSLRIDTQEDLVEANNSWRGLTVG